MISEKINELCKIKGHMWYTNKRINIKKEDGVYSIPIEIICVRCSKIEKYEKNKK